MAYQSIQGTASGRLDLLNKIKDFLVTTVGWTLHDDQSADARPYYVFKSTGESGAEDIYLRFQIGQSSGRIEVAAFQYWDVTRGSVGGGEDLLDPNPVVDILEVSQGATIFQEGIDSDDFSNTAQSDIYHAEWDARVNELGKFASPDRSAISNPLEVDSGSSDASFFGSLALLPGSEQVILEQNDWSEERNINPYAVFEKPPAMLQVTPNIGRRGQTGIAVTGINFTPDRSGIVLRCDGRVMASNLVSDDAGRVTASFTVPTEARNGNRIVRVPVVRTVWRTRTIFVRRDPLAQTFSFTENRVLSAVGIQFTQRDASIPVTVQIRGVTTGLPNDTIFAEKVIAPSEINLGGETKISFDDPFYAEANTSYAVVLLTNSTNYKVRTATLGKTGRQGIITRQTYAEGVLLESSNAETWTPLNGSDLTMKLYGYEFENEGTVQFQPVSGVQFSDLNK